MTRIKPSCLLLTLMTLLAGLAAPTAFAQQPRKISFDRDIRPILSDRCYSCHGPDANSRAADLRLDLQEESHGFAIEPGSLDDSELWARINSDDESDVMPPPESSKARLNDAELGLIKQWIEEGAKYENFWAFEPPAKKDPPPTVAPGWDRSVIDRFVIAKLAEKNQQPAEEADARTLVRRAALDLTGLPPTTDQIAQFLQDEEKLGREVAWERWIDQLLASPQYGEHLARHWLDLVRFADTNGMHKDFYRNHFAYRDWVIRSFNDNLGYDKFLTYQLAGDLFDKPTPEQLTASAFNRLHLIIDRGTALPEESFHKNVVDRVTSVSTAFLGLTMQCAQCHDHKYDPISQKDFYSLYGFFNNIDAAPETVASPRNGLQPPFVSLASDDQKKRLKVWDDQLAALDRELASMTKQLEATQAALRKLTKTSPSEVTITNHQDERRQLMQRQEKLEAAQAELEAKKRQAQSDRSQYDRTVPYVMVMKERAKPRPTYLLERGQYDAPGEQVDRGTPSFLPPLKKTGEQASRMDLARWFVSKKHPLTARVAVNRIWQTVIGRGLVKTSEDFGAQGDVPSHPELLDHLSVSFVESGWDIKRLVKQIAMSKTYRQSSKLTAEQYQADPENRWLARGSRFRLDAEVIRDQILFTSGSLCDTMYGPSVKPPQPDGLWKAVTMIGERYVADQGEAARRRSLYTFWKRGMPPPQMTILNAPARDSCIARRERTNTPAQALLLLNEPAFFAAARSLAQQTLKRPAEQRIRFAWETITGKLPDEQDRQQIRTLEDQLMAYYADAPQLADLICRDLELSSPNEKQSIATWTAVLNTIYNLDITRTRD